MSDSSRGSVDNIKLRVPVPSLVSACRAGGRGGEGAGWMFKYVNTFDELLESGGG